MTEKKLIKSLYQRILKITDYTFEKIALDVFQYQAKYNPLYGRFLSLLGIRLNEIESTDKIPFLPIQLFKKHKIQTNVWNPETEFTSSGTSGQIPSRHYIKSLKFYEQISKLGFEKFYGDSSQYCFLALLPSYLERSGSSLIYMIDFFIQRSVYKQSGFYLYNTDDLVQTIKKCKAENIPVVLIGVSFALLDLAEKEKVDISDCVVMETGGMKGRRKEITREELHQNLKRAFNVQNVHSEYGMTELLSQAYAKKTGRFYCSPTMKVKTREISDPLSLQKNGKTGVVNVIDLANVDTCSFIATDDLGIVYEDESFEILGRLDASDIRGCNLMVKDL